MLKISEGKPGKHITTLRLEGRVVGPWADELKQVCEPFVKKGCKLALDLAEVTYADGDGLNLLASLRARGVRLLKAMPFVQEQLKSANLSF